MNRMIKAAVVSFVALTLGLCALYVYGSVAVSLPSQCSAGDMIIRTDSTFWVCPVTATSTAGWVQIGTAGSGAPTGAGYLVTAADGGLSAEQVVAPTNHSVIIANGTNWVTSTIGAPAHGQHQAYDTAGHTFAVVNDPVQVITTTGDVTDSTGASTYTDCTGLASALVSGATYMFQADVLLTTPAATNGYAVTVTGPATTYLAYQSSVPTASNASSIINATAYQQPAATATAVFATTGYVRLNGTIRTSAVGGITIQFATEADGQAVVCKAGSTLQVWGPY